MCGICFFKQKTAYEMRISDWSSDVCSSDLVAQALEGGRAGTLSPLVILGVLVFAGVLVLFICFMELGQRRVLIQYPKRQTARGQMQRSEERRVWKECVSTCRSRRSTYH